MTKLLRHIRQSLSTKLSLGFVMLAVPIFMVSLGVLWLQSRHIIRKETRLRVAAVLETSTQHIRTLLSTIETATQVNAWMATENMQPDSLIQLSRRIVLLNRNVNGCSISAEPYLFPECGRYFSAYSIVDGDSVITQREGEYEYFERLWYKSPKILGEACWVDPYSDYNDSTLYTTEVIASYCKPLYKKVREEEHLLGVISCDISMRMLAQALATEVPFPNAYYMLIGPNGNYYVHPDSTRLYQTSIFTGADPQHHPELITLGHEMTEGRQGAMTLQIDGVKTLVCYRQVPGTQWSLALVCPDSDILSRLHQLSWVVLLVTLVGLIVIVLLCRRLVNHAISPLWDLVGMTKQMASGIYEVQIATTSRPDAVGQLQNSFATMQESLEHHVGAIRQVNEDLLQSNEELAEATRLAAEAAHQKLLFIQNMTHQVRTPLNIILGFAQVLLDCASQLHDDEVQNITKVMDHNVVALNRMVLMLYDSSDTGRSEDLAVKKQAAPESCLLLARECIDFTLHHFPEVNIQLDMKVGDDCMVYANRLYMMRSLRELLYNAAKYSDGQHILLRIEETDSSIVFTIQDTGPGIPHDNIEQMFTPFAKINDLSEGLGLGLPLTRRHVYDMGGDFVFDAAYQEGCRFIITMPKAK